MAHGAAFRLRDDPSRAMPLSGMGPSRTHLVVFADDWSRHPSSCQHLVRHLREEFPTLWVNTIGTRAPRATRADLARAAGKLREWAGLGARDEGEDTGRFRVISPPMLPYLRRTWQRHLNRRLLGAAIDRALGPRRPGERRVVLTTLPLTATLLGRIDVDAWIYYCVDDWTVWAGREADVTGALERQLVAHCDAVVAASPALQERLRALGRDSVLLTHGVDVDHWASPGGVRAPGPEAVVPGWGRLPRPIHLFWGAADRRLDFDWLRELDASARATGGSVVLLGPSHDLDDRIRRLARAVVPGPVPYAALPGLAADSQVLIMPYAESPTTLAMQPLKLKEYLATGKPVVVRDLPATRPWADAADVVESAREFAERATRRASEGIPATQREARRRLVGESWAEKARHLRSVITHAE